MRVSLHKLKGVSRVIVRGVKPSKKGVCISTTEKNSTMSDTIGLAVLITSLLVLSLGMPIVYDNQNDTD